MTINGWERRILSGTRFFTLAAVIASFAGALLMFFMGLTSTWEAFAAQFIPEPTSEAAEELPEAEATVISLMVALDRFMLGVVLLYFGYGVYSLFVRPKHSSAELGLPEWLHVTQIGQLKQTLAEVIIVVLFVLFLRVALETFQGGELGYTQIARFLILPVSILLLAGALRLVELHPKPRRTPHPDTIAQQKAEARKQSGQDEDSAKDKDTQRD